MILISITNSFYVGELGHSVNHFSIFPYFNSMSDHKLHITTTKKKTSSINNTSLCIHTLLSDHLWFADYPFVYKSACSVSLLQACIQPAPRTINLLHFSYPVHEGMLPLVCFEPGSCQVQLTVPNSSYSPFLSALYALRVIYSFPEFLS